MRDDARPVVEQVRVESCRPDDWIRIEAETEQGRGDLRGDTELDVAQRRRPPGISHDRGLRRRGVVPADAKGRERRMVGHHSRLAESQQWSRRTAWSG